MPTTNPDLFARYQYGDNSEYKERYTGFIRKSGSGGLCHAAAIYFIEQVVSDRQVTFNPHEVCTSIIINDLLEKQEKYRGEIREGILTPAEHTKDSLKKSIMANPSNYHGRGFSSKVLSTEDPDRVIGKILTHRDRYPCGVIAIYRRGGAHAVAYACDKTYLYLYDPNYGIMRFMRGNSSSLREAFFFFTNTNRNYKIRYIEQVYCRRPAKVSEPGRKFWGSQPLI